MAGLCEQCLPTRFPINELRTTTPPELPEDVLREIFSQLPFHDTPITRSTHAALARYGVPGYFPRLKTLASVCLVSKTCYRLAQPLLYRYIHLVGYKTTQRTMELLLRSLINNPKLARAVRVLRAVRWFQPEPPLTELDVEWKDEFAACLKAVTQLLPLPDGLNKRLHDGLLRRLPDAHIALLLVLCTNIQVLDITGPDLERNLITDIVDVATSATLPDLGCNRNVPLSQIREIWVQDLVFKPPALQRPEWPSSSTQVLSILPFLSLPSVCVFHGSNIMWDEMLDDRTRRGSTTLKIAQFRYNERSGQRIGSIPTFLRLYPSLQVLEIEYGCCEPGNYSLIGDALRIFGKALQSLVLNLYESYEGVLEEDMAPDRIYGVGDLRELMLLKSLNIAQCGLFGWWQVYCYDPSYRQQPLQDILPASLQDLCITQIVPEDVISTELTQFMTDHRFQTLTDVSLELKDEF